MVTHLAWAAFSVSVPQVRVDTAQLAFPQVIEDSQWFHCELLQVGTPRMNENPTCDSQTLNHSEINPTSDQKTLAVLGDTWRYLGCHFKFVIRRQL